MNIDINIPSKQDIQKQRDSEEDIETFDWDKEFNFIDDNLVKERKVIEKINRDVCKGRIVTLEGNYFDLDCSVQEGIKITMSEKEETQGMVFESLENLLMKLSPLYQESFFNF